MFSIIIVISSVAQQVIKYPYVTVLCNRIRNCRSQSISRDTIIVNNEVYLLVFQPPSRLENDLSTG